MITIHGKTPEANASREMDAWIEGDDLYLHIHSEGTTENGWAIRFSKEQIVKAVYGIVGTK